MSQILFPGHKVPFDLNTKSMSGWTLTNYITAHTLMNRTCSTGTGNRCALVGRDCSFSYYNLADYSDGVDLPLPKQVYGHGWLALDGKDVNPKKRS